jgi:hypothetical protein
MRGANSCIREKFVDGLPASETIHPVCAGRTANGTTNKRMGAGVFVVMPNHIHGIIIIVDGRGTALGGRGTAELIEAFDYESTRRAPTDDESIRRAPTDDGSTRRAPTDYDSPSVPLRTIHRPAMPIQRNNSGNQYRVPFQPLSVHTNPPLPLQGTAALLRQSGPARSVESEWARSGIDP